MTTKLDIANRTLIKLGCETISDLTTNNKPTRLFNAIYEDCKKEELQKHNWIFAKKNKKLFAKDIYETIENFVLTQNENVEFIVDNNIIHVVAKEVGEEFNNIGIYCTNNKIKCNSLCGGTATNKASGSIVFYDNIDVGDNITIGEYTYIAGVDFNIGQQEIGKFKRLFELPTDFLLLLGIENFNALSTTLYQHGSYSEYGIYGNNILCNRPYIVVDYTSNIDDDDLDVNFVNVLACRLASELCEAILQSDNKNKFFIEKYMLAVRDAKRINAIQMPNACLGSGVLERSRL